MKMKPEHTVSLIPGVLLIDFQSDPVGVYGSIETAMQDMEEDDRALPAMLIVSAQDNSIIEWADLAIAELN